MVKKAVITTKNLIIRPKVDACVAHRKVIVIQARWTMTSDRTRLRVTRDIYYHECAGHRRWIQIHNSFTASCMAEQYVP